MGYEVSTVFFHCFGAAALSYADRFVTVTVTTYEIQKPILKIEFLRNALQTIICGAEMCETSQEL